MSESSSSSEPRRSQRNVPHKNRLFNETEATDFANKYSVFPNFISKGDIIRLLKHVEVSVVGMNLSARDGHVSTTHAYHHSATMKFFDIDKVSKEMQQLEDRKFHIGGSSMVQVIGKSTPSLPYSPSLSLLPLTSLSFSPSVV